MKKSLMKVLLIWRIKNGSQKKEEIENNDTSLRVRDTVNRACVISFSAADERQVQVRTAIGLSKR